MNSFQARFVTIQNNKKLLTSKRIPVTIKAKIYNTYVLPVVLYGLECATWTITSTTKLETFQNHIMRFMTSPKLQHHVTIESLRSQTKLKPISAATKERKLKLFGHIKLSSVGLSEFILEGRPNSTRNRGRPKRRWTDDIKTWIGLPSWDVINAIVMDRGRWRSLYYNVSYSV